jgi:hypothetical protein
VWKGFHHRGVHGKHRVEEVGEPYTVCLGNHPEKSAVPIKAPGPTLLHHVDAVFLVAVEENVFDFSGGGLVGELNNL